MLLFEVSMPYSGGGGPVTSSADAPLVLQLGLETDTEQPHPTPVRQLPNIMSIALGVLHAPQTSSQVVSVQIVKIFSDRRPKLLRASLTSMGVLTAAACPQAGCCCGTQASVAPGGLHSIAVSGSGQILTWGANQNGLLGLGSSAQQNVPTPTPVPDVFAAHVSNSAATA
jgi:Regulator of chromosome condensation (RCC1) repeat